MKDIRLKKEIFKGICRIPAYCTDTWYECPTEVKIYGILDRSLGNI